MTALNYLRRTTVRAIKHLQLTSRGLSRSATVREKSSFEPKKILIVSKLSRYHYEKLQEPNLGEEELRNKLIEKGSDYETLRASHDATEAVKNEVIQLFRKLDVEYKVVDRTTVNTAGFAWADLILPIGGDGTFLLASNMIYDNTKPIMGINSYPQKSRGYLMLSPKYTKNIPQIFEMLKTGNFNILMRRRIRTTLKGDQIHCAPFHMHQKAGCIPGIERFYEDSGGENSLIKEKRLPWLALNEVFIGEALAAKTSTLLIKVNDYEKYHKVKSSGLCVSTGTGSTSWYKAINSITPQTMREILNLVDRTTNFSDEQIEGICATFNNKLQFDPDDPKLGYALRETIITHTQSVPEDLHRDFCEKLTVRSQCNDGALVIDSGVAIPFNIGATAVLESHSEDSLKCITLPQ